MFPLAFYISQHRADGLRLKGMGEIHVRKAFGAQKTPHRRRGLECEELPAGIDLAHFDYVKTGPYVEALGGLKSRKTNQRLYRVTGGMLEDITARFWK